MINFETMSSEQYSTIIRYVEERGRARLLARGEIDDADYLCGAMVALEAVGMLPNKYPARWIFNLMAGDSPLRWQEEATS